MIHREPDKRLEAEDYLKQQRGNAFPEIVYTFLQPYMAGPVCQRNISFCRWAYSGYKEGFGQHHSQSLWTRSAGESGWRAQGEWAGYLGVSYNVLPADPEILRLQACRFGTYSPFGPKIKCRNSFGSYYTLSFAFQQWLCSQSKGRSLEDVD